MTKSNIYGKIAVFAALILTIGTLNFITPAGAVKSTELNVQLIKTEPVPLQTGEYADVWLKVRNNGEQAAQNASLELITDFPFSADPDEELMKNLGKVYPGQEYYVHYQVRVSENAVQGSNDLKFKVHTSEDFSYTEEVQVQIRTDDAALLVQKVETDPSPLAPSKTGKVTVTVKNLADSYLKNIEVSLGLDSSSQSDEIPLVPVESTTRKRIQKLEAGKTGNVTYKIKADSDADSKAYKVPIDLNYENDAGTSFSQQEYTGIVIGGIPELEMNLVDNQILKSGNSGELTVSIVNRGLSIAKFANLELLGSDSFKTVSSSKIYIGNMDSDEYESASFDIYVKEGTESVELPFEITYKDSEGEARTEKHTLKFDTYSQEEINEMQLVDQNNTLMLAVIVVVLLVAAYAGYKYWKSKKKKLLEE